MPGFIGSNMETQLQLDFDGSTFDSVLDRVRLSNQARLVFDLMRDGQWRTLAEIVESIGCGSEAGVSARLRDFRKPRFGSLVVDRRRRGDGASGLFEYQLRLI
jgi:hypothetical protein